MDDNRLTAQIGQKISLPGHFDVPVVLEDARPLGTDDDSTGYERRVRLPDGSLEEVVISAEEAAALVLEAHYTTHIEGTRLTLEQSERLWAGEEVPEADPDDARELLNYRFKRLFTISGFYDRDRGAFYRAIQSVRERGMDLTGWLEYFVDGPSTQLTEVKQRSEQAIRRDLLVKQHGLSDRQSKASDQALPDTKLKTRAFYYDKL